MPLVEDNDAQGARKALESWTRVKCKKNGRLAKELAKAKGFHEVSREKYYQQF